MPAERSTTDSAVYAQARRNNEKEVREELRKRVSCDPNASILGNRGDLTQTAKILASALLEIDSATILPSPQHRSNHGLIDHNLLRRKNEKIICDKLERLVPEQILHQGFMQQGNLNRTTKIAIATAKYLDSLHCSSVTNTNPFLQNTMSLKRKYTDSDEDSSYSEEDAATRLSPTPVSNTSSALQGSKSYLSTNISHLDFSSGRALRSDSNEIVTNTMEAVQPLTSGRRYPKRGTFSKPPSELHAKPPPIPSAMKEMVALQVIFRDYSKITDEKNSPFRPDGKKQKVTMQQMVDEIYDDEATELELCQQLEHVAGRLMRTARGLSTPQYCDVEADMNTGKIHSVGSTRTVVSDPKKELIWVIELIIDAIQVVKHIKGYDKVVEKWNSRKEVWIREGMLAEEVD